MFSVYVGNINSEIACHPGGHYLDYNDGDLSFCQFGVTQVNIDHP